MVKRDVVLDPEGDAAYLWSVSVYYKNTNNDWSTEASKIKNLAKKQNKSNTGHSR